MNATNPLQLPICKICGFPGIHFVSEVACLSTAVGAIRRARAVLKEGRAENPIATLDKVREILGEGT